MARERGNSTAGLQRAPREEELGGRERGGTTAGLLKSHSLGRSGDGAKHRPVGNPTKAELAGGKRDSDVSSVGSGWATGEVGREGLGAVAIRIGGCFPRRSTVPCGVYLQATEFRTGSRQERPRSEGENGDLGGASRWNETEGFKKTCKNSANWWRVNGGERETERGLIEKAVEGM
jgi:hypothetical protein